MALNPYDIIARNCGTKFSKKVYKKVDNDKTHNVKLSDIKTKKGFNNVLKKYFLHSYTIEPEVIFY